MAALYVAAAFPAPCMALLRQTFSKLFSESWRSLATPFASEKYRSRLVVGRKESDRTKPLGIISDEGGEV